MQALASGTVDVCSGSCLNAAPATIKALGAPPVSDAGYVRVTGVTDPGEVVEVMERSYNLNRGFKGGPAEAARKLSRLVSSFSL